MRLLPDHHNMTNVARRQVKQASESPNTWESYAYAIGY